MDRVLVTGGAGYIGSHVVAALAERGYTVLTVDNLSQGRRESVLAGELAVGDLADTVFLDSTIRDFQPDAVMHFAAFIEVGESVRNPLKYYHNNAGNTVNLLSAMERHGISTLIFSSTAAVYGTPAGPTVAEGDPMRPINPYGRAKAFVEDVLADAAAARGLRYVSLRYFNAAGADPAGRIGECHEPESHLIPLALKAAAGTGPTLAIFGDDYATPDGTCVRDFVHVTDLAEAHLCSLRYLAKGNPSDVFNCGYGHGYSVREVIETASRVTGVSIPYRVAPRRPGDPPVLVAKSDKLRSNLGWKPVHDDLEFIIGTAWRWEQKQSSKKGHAECTQ